MRPVWLSRKNSLFAGSDVGAPYCSFDDVLIKQENFASDFEISGRRERLASASRVRVLWTKFWVMTVSGVLAAVGGILLAGYVQAGFYNIGRELEIDAISAAVIGGTALFGGRGTVQGTVIGVLTLGVLNTGLLILGTQTSWQLIVKGGLVILAIAMGEAVRRRAQMA
jgi:ribose transport system permease protein